MTLDWVVSLNEILSQAQVVGSDAFPLEVSDLIYDDVINPHELTVPLVIRYLQEEQSIQAVFGSLEVMLVRQNVLRENWNEIARFLRTKLVVPPGEWNWNIVDKTNFHRRFYYPLRVLRVLVETGEGFVGEGSFPFSELIEMCGKHINPFVPWSSTTNSRIITSILQDKRVRQYFDDNMVEFMDKLGEKLIKIPSSVSKKPGKTKSSQLLQGGLRPRLGYGGSKKEILEEDIRRNWKLSMKVVSLSMVWLVIYMIKPQTDWFDSYWTVILSFILNVGDDHDPVMKIQSFKMMAFFLDKIESLKETHLLVKSGLLDVYIEQGKIALAHIPPTTPKKVSEQVLGEAYSSLNHLLKVKSPMADIKTEFIDIITINILPSISRLVIRGEREDYLPILDLLVTNLNTIIEEHLHHGILISLSRVHFTLNQLITNPYLIENKTGGFAVIENALKCQATIAEQILNTRDPQAMGVLWNYKYDFLGAWIVLITRLHKMEAENQGHDIIKQLQKNFEILKRILADGNYDLKKDSQQIFLKTPGLESIMTTNGLNF